MPTKKDKKAAGSALKAAASPSAIPNAAWSNNNAACTNTWFCLSKEIMGQLEEDFDDAEIVRMSELAFWNDNGASNREDEAGSIADMLTKMFTNMLGATYESGHNYASAVLAMTEVLTDANKTVSELAAVVDEQHRFLTEPV